MAERGWVTMVQLPACAPDLNRAEGIELLPRIGPLANVRFTEEDHLTTALPRACGESNYGPKLINDCVAETVFTMSNYHSTIH